MSTRVDNSKIRVQWNEGQQQWVVVGGYLPEYECWDAFDDRDSAIRAAMELCEDMDLEYAP